jgi:hypothetical protein
MAVAAVLPHQRDDVGGESLHVLSAPPQLALGRAVLTECAAGAALGDAQPRSDVLDAGAPARGA